MRYVLARHLLRVTAHRATLHRVTITQQAPRQQAARMKPALPTTPAPRTRIPLRIRLALPARKTHHPRKTMSIAPTTSVATHGMLCGLQCIACCYCCYCCLSFLLHGLSNAYVNVLNSRSSHGNNAPPTSVRGSASAASRARNRSACTRTPPEPIAFTASVPHRQRRENARVLAFRQRVHGIGSAKASREGAKFLCGLFSISPFLFIMVYHVFIKTINDE